MTVSDSWVTGKQAVNFFSTWCAARSWVFQPVDASNDFGKDGYVDITDDNGRLTGELFSVQFKGGESWTAAGGYRIPVGKHRDVWMYSMVPVIGVVHDPKDGRLRWVNLTAALREHRELASVHVPDGALLDADEQLQVLIESVRVTTRPGLPTALGSDSGDEQEAAVWDCFAMARRDADALIAVRRSFLALGRHERGDLSLVFVTEMVAFFEMAGWVTPTAQPKPGQVPAPFFGFRRTAFGLIRVRTDGERLLVFSDTGKRDVKEAYAYDIPPAGESKPSSLRRA